MAVVVAVAIGVAMSRLVPAAAAAAGLAAVAAAGLAAVAAILSAADAVRVLASTKEGTLTPSAPAPEPES